MTTAKDCLTGVTELQLLCKQMKLEKNKCEVDILFLVLNIPVENATISAIPVVLKICRAANAVGVESIFF